MNFQQICAELMADEMQDSVFHNVYIPWKVQVSSQQSK